MTTPKPVVYLFCGEDEFAIAQEIASLEGKMGDAALASLNTHRLDGQKTSLEEIRGIALAMPVLVERRLVVLERPLASVNNPYSREKFLELLKQIPSTTALILVEYQNLTSEKERRDNKIHWLEWWVDQAGERAYKRLFPLPKGVAMQRWIQEQAVLMDGQFTPQAAALLGDLVGEDTRLAYHETEKLLAYAGYLRPVEVEDVENLAISARQADIFALVDAIGNADGRRALGLLHRLLAEQDASMIFGMVVRQFRLLIQSRDVLDHGGTEREVVTQAGLNPYVAGKIVPQARHFSIDRLIEVYHHLLEIDESVKSGQVEIDIALDTFIAAFTTQP
jgi:DNA polymerase-3 subunit delta